MEDDPDKFLTDKSVDSRVPGITSSMKGVVPNVVPGSITIGVDCEGDVNTLGLEELDDCAFDLNSEMLHLDLNEVGSEVVLVRNCE